MGAAVDGRVGTTVGAGVGRAVGAGDAVGLTVALGAGLGWGDGVAGGGLVAAGVGAGDALGEGDGDGARVGVAEADGDGLGVGRWVGRGARVAMMTGARVGATGAANGVGDASARCEPAPRWANAAINAPTPKPATMIAATSAKNGTPPPPRPRDAVRLDPLAGRRRGERELIAGSDSTHALSHPQIGPEPARAMPATPKPTV